MTAPTLDAARAAILTTPATSARATALAMLDAADAAPTSTMAARRWFARVERVDTLQLTGDDTGRVRGAWMPLARRVDASRSTFVTLDGSRRDYAGCRTLAADDATLVLDTGDALAIYRRTVAAAPLPRHDTDAGDWCPYSGGQPDARDGGCPQGCSAVRPDDDMEVTR